MTLIQPLDPLLCETAYLYVSRHAVLCFDLNKADGGAGCSLDSLRDWVTAVGGTDNA